MEQPTCGIKLQVAEYSVETYTHNLIKEIKRDMESEKYWQIE